MGKRKHGKKIYNIELFCTNCGASLFTYGKEGPGHLVKCYQDGITDDHTSGELFCPECKEPYAREAMMHGRSVRKIIQGKIRVKGHVKT